MDLTELNLVRFVTGSRPKIDPRVLIAQNINEWVYNHVVIHVEQLLISMPAKEGECSVSHVVGVSGGPSAMERNKRQWPGNPRQPVSPLAPITPPEEKGLNKKIMDELFTAPSSMLTEYSIMLC